MNPTAALILEPKPRDFIARFSRRRALTIGARARRKHLGKRAAVLLVACAVPAFAAPGQWGSFDIGNAGRAELVLEPMPFEKPGDSFPGSAFYYLAPDEPAPVLADGAHWDNEDKPAPVDPLTGPAARALRVDNSGIDRSRALQCLTAAIYYEAASEPDAGQRAVAQVVLNRVAHRSFPGTICGVVFQGSERKTGCQFSFTCDGALARKPAAFFWRRAEDVARAALSGYVYAPVGLATHYHTIAVHPYWADSLNHLGTIGAHRFYKFNGSAGQPAAFRFAYGGGEPLPAPHARSAAADAQTDLAMDPLALQRAFESGLKSAQDGATPAPGSTVSAARPAAPVTAPAYTTDLQQRGGEALYRGQNLPEAHGIRPEYQNSGRWISKPGG